MYNIEPLFFLQKRITEMYFLKTHKYNLWQKSKSCDIYAWDVGN
jgi:hypothetical protein